MNVRLWWLLLGISWLVPWQACGIAQAATLSAERQQFVEARAAIKRGDLARARVLRRHLTVYPLKPYLDIWLAWKQMGKGDDSLVAPLVARYEDIPESWDLHLAWIKNLARRGQWPVVAAEMDSFSLARSRLPELSMLARFYSGDQDGARAQFAKYWLSGKKIPSSLQAVAHDWRRHGHPSAVERWQRTTTLAKHRKWSEVSALIRPLPAMDHQLIQHWREGVKDSERVILQWPTPARAMPHEAQVLSYLLRRLSRQDPLLARQQLDRLAHAFSPKLLQDLQRRLALRAARHQLSIAANWLEALPDEAQDDTSRSWRARMLLQQRDWPGLTKAIAAMPSAQRHQSEWAYWQARALEQQGAEDAAKAIFMALAQDRGYFSFLSAERLGLPYHLVDQPPQVAEDVVTALHQRDGIRRAQEWLLLGEQGKARREWYRALQEMDQQRWQAAAVLAIRWGWHDRAILALYRAGALDALSGRFPMPFQRQLQRAGRDSGLSPSLILGLVRQESGFNVQAESPRGAMGLMQLMPKTANMLARKLKLSRPSGARLLNPGVNMRLGSYYLASMQKRFDGNIALAAAAYNAGPTRVRRWLKRQSYDDGAIWVASIPFDETRRYVQHVLSYAVVYDWRRGVQPVMISQRLGEPEHLALR
ncbi:MAG: transglycosylase SLT domain-containing protein [Mariprofundales bacterium]